MGVVALIGTAFSPALGAGFAVVAAGVLCFAALDVAPRVAAVVPRVGAAPRLTSGFDGLGVAVGAVDLAFARVAAVGLLSRSATSDGRTCFFAGMDGISGALRDFASDAAVGANRPDAGVFGRMVEEGVLGRVGVFARAGVMGGGRTDALDDGRELGAALTLLMLGALRRVGGAEVDAESDVVPWCDVGGDLAGARVSFVEVVAGGRLDAVFALDGVAGVRVLAAEPVLD